MHPYPADKLGTFKAEVRKLYTTKGIPYPDPDSENWFSQWGWDCGAVGYDAATSSQLQQIKDKLGIVPEPPPGPPPSDGPTKPWTGHSRSVGTVWHDDSGPRAPRFCSLFAAIRQYRDNRPLFTRNLDSMVGYWHGFRMCWCLMGAPWDAHGLEVDIRQPGYDELFEAVLREAVVRNLRVCLTSGTLHPHQLPDAETNYRRIAKICAAVSPHVVFAHSVINEPGMTSPYGDGPSAWPYYYKLLTIFKSEYPWNHHGTGCQGGDPEAIENDGAPSGVILGSKSPATMACVQGTRSPWKNALERAFDMGYRVRPAVGTPVLEEEPSGNNGLYTGPGSVYQPMNDRDALFAYYTLKLITGQALISLNSCGLVEQNPLDSVWGFKEIPQLWAQMGIPEDVGTWKPAHLHALPITGSGMYRLDGSFNPETGETIGVAHDNEGPGPWVVRSKVTGQARVYRADGLRLDKHVNAGDEIFSEGGNPPPTVIHVVPA